MNLAVDLGINAEELRQQTVFDLADELRFLKERKEGLAAEVKENNESIKVCEERLAEMMINEELTRFNRGGLTFYVTIQLHASAVAGQQEALYAVLREQGAESLIKETVNANSLKSWVKEQREQNDDELPEYLEGLVNVYERTIAGMRKG